MSWGLKSYKNRENSSRIVSNPRKREINVHFSQFPDELERLNQNDIESAFQMSVKEADQIRSKSQNTANFQTTDWKRLWHGIVEGDLAEWNTIGR